MAGHRCRRLHPLGDATYLARATLLGKARGNRQTSVSGQTHTSLPPQASSWDTSLSISVKEPTGAPPGSSASRASRRKPLNSGPDTATVRRRRETDRGGSAMPEGRREEAPQGPDGRSHTESPGEDTAATSPHTAPDRAARPSLPDLAPPSGAEVATRAIPARPGTAIREQTWYCHPRAVLVLPSLGRPGARRPWAEVATVRPLRPNELGKRWMSYPGPSLRILGPLPPPRGVEAGAGHRHVKRASRLPLSQSADDGFSAAAGSGSAGGRARPAFTSQPALCRGTGTIKADTMPRK